MTRYVLFLLSFFAFTAGEGTAQPAGLPDFHHEVVTSYSPVPLAPITPEEEEKTPAEALAAAFPAEEQGREGQSSRAALPVEKEVEAGNEDDAAELVPMQSMLPDEGDDSVVFETEEGWDKAGNEDDAAELVPMQSMLPDEDDDSDRAAAPTWQVSVLQELPAIQRRLLDCFPQNSREISQFLDEVLGLIEKGSVGN